MKKTICVFLVLLTMLTLCSCLGSAKIGTIDGKDVSVEAFNYFLHNVKEELLFEAGVMEGGAETFWQTEVEGKKAIELAKEKAFEEVMSFEAKYLKAVENGFSIDENCRQNVEDRFNDAASAKGGESELKAFLKEMGSSEKAYKEILEKSYCVTKFIGEYKKTSNEFEVTQNEIYNRIYEEYGEMGPITSIMAKQIIFVTVDDEKNPISDEEITAKKELADRVYNRIMEGEDFDTLMNQYSEDPDLKNNLDGYMILKDEVSEDFKAKIFSLKNDTVSQPIKTDYGYHIIKVLSKNFSTMESLSTNITYELEKEKESAVAEKWKKDYTITRNDKEFEKIQ